MSTKATFFDRLYTLLENDQELPGADQELAAIFSASRKATPLPIHRPVLKKSNTAEPKASPKRADPTKPRAPTTDTEIVPLQRSNTAPEKSTTTIKPLIAERQPNKDAALILPKNLQIFRGCVFLFIRVDQVSAERRLRHAKAREYGAKHAIALDDTVTHIVVDKDLEYEDVLRFLQTDYIPTKTTPSLVNQRYPGDCITYQRLLDPNQIIYAVRGVPVTPTSTPSKGSEIPTTESQRSTGSIQVQAWPTDKNRKTVETPTPPQTRIETTWDAFVDRLVKRAGPGGVL